MTVAIEPTTGQSTNESLRDLAGRSKRGRARFCTKPRPIAPVRDDTNGSGQGFCETHKPHAAPANKPKGHTHSETHSPPALRPEPNDGQLSRETQTGAAVAGDVRGGQHEDETHLSSAAPAIATIRARHRERCFAIAQQNRLDNATRSYIRTCEGWRLDLPEKERNAIRDRAMEFFKQLDGGAITDANRAYAVLVTAATQARSAFDGIRAACEKIMIEAAKSLPAYPFVESVKGAGALGLAVIVGEAGDIGSYANPGKLWKRLGLAPQSCYGHTREDGTSYIAKPKQRRSRMFTVGDSLLRQQNAYRELYLWRKRYEIANHPEWFKGLDAKGNPKTAAEANFRAHRYAEKRFVKHLWMRWTGRHELDIEIPPAPALPELGSGHPTAETQLAVAASD